MQDEVVVALTGGHHREHLFVLFDSEVDDDWSIVD
jgi:hypothetical protein